ncbi:MAG TPA: hypothetical protein VEX15_23730 [Nocardioidaceae bacterium]|nr:hypothetical protein [Nocardioidaceae bacterium]
MSTPRLARWAPITGIGFVALAIAVISLEGEEPADNANPADIVSSWLDRADTALLSVFLATGAAVCLLAFGATLRSALRSRESGEASSSTVAFAGTIIAAVGLLFSATVSFAASESAEQGHTDPTVALDALASEGWIPITGGFAAMFLATGIGAIRSGGLPSLLGWSALVLGAAFVTPAGLVAFFLTPLWIIATSVVLVRAGDRRQRFSSAPQATQPAH